MNFLKSFYFKFAYWDFWIKSWFFTKYKLTKEPSTFINLLLLLILIFKFNKPFLFFCQHSKNISNVLNLFFILNFSKWKVIFFRDKRIYENSKRSVNSSKSLNNSSYHYSYFDQNICLSRGIWTKFIKNRKDFAKFCLY